MFSLCFRFLSLTHCTQLSILFLSFFVSISSLSNSIPTRILTREEIDAFKRDGVIMVKNLIDKKDLNAAVVLVKKMSEVKDPMFGESYKQIKFQTWRTNKVLERISTRGNVPNAVKQLIAARNNDDKKQIRLLKDAILCYYPDGNGCGWHVDDKFFWPCHDAEDYSVKSSGVNVWIALSEMPAVHGGGLAVALGSFKDPIALSSIPLIHSQGTCSMAQISPEVNAHLENMKTV